MKESQTSQNNSEFSGESQWSVNDRGSQLPLFSHWIKFSEWMLERTEKFPKSARFTFSSRIDNMMLDTLEDIVEARYTRDRRTILRRINLRLEKLRFIVRLSQNRRYLSVSAYEYASRAIDTAGKMTGGWCRRESGK